MLRWGSKNRQKTSHFSGKILKWVFYTWIRDNTNTWVGLRCPQIFEQGLLENTKPFKFTQSYIDPFKDKYMHEVIKNYNHLKSM